MASHTHVPRLPTGREVPSSVIVVAQRLRGVALLHAGRDVIPVERADLETVLIYLDELRRAAE